MPRSKKSDSKLAPAQATGTLNIIFQGLCALVPRKKSGTLQDVVVLMPDARNPNKVVENNTHGAKNKRFLPHPCFLLIDKKCFNKKPNDVDQIVVIDGREKYLWILDNDDIKFSIGGGNSISGSLNGLIHMTSMHQNLNPNLSGLEVDPKFIKPNSFDRSLVARTVINTGVLIPQGSSANHRLPDSNTVNTPELKVSVSDVTNVVLNITDHSGKRGVFNFSITLDNLPSISNTEGHIIINNMSATSIESTSLVGDPDYDFELVYSVRNNAQDTTRGFDIRQAGLPIRTTTAPPLVCAMAVYNEEIIP